MILKADKIKVDIDLIRHRPNEAGLIGAVHLAPAWMFQAHDAILASTSIRAGVVRLNLRKAADLSKADVWKSELWRHADEKLNRDEAVQRLKDMLLGARSCASRNKSTSSLLMAIGLWLIL